MLERQDKTNHPYRVTRQGLGSLYVVPLGGDSYGLANPEILMGNDNVVFFHETGRNLTDWEAADYKETFEFICGICGDEGE